MNWLFKQQNCDTPTASVTDKYPNPANESLTLQYEIEEGQNAEFAIYDITGKEIKRFSLSDDNQSMTISLNSFSNGLFIGKIFNAAGEVFSQKILVIK